MPATRFQSSSSSTLKFATLAAALANVPIGAWTFAVLLKRIVDPTGSTNFDGLAYLLSGSGAGVTEAGLSLTGGDALFSDVAGLNNSNQGTNPFTVTGTAETYIVVGSRAAGTGTVLYDRYAKSSNTWIHNTPGGSTLPDQIAATMLEIGAWEGGDLIDDSYVGVVGIWSAAMSSTQKEELSANWRTSDWWNNSVGAPKFIAELNVAAASVVDLAQNATGLSVTGTSLDAAETLVGWTYDGTGVVAPPSGIPGIGVGTIGMGTIGGRGVTADATGPVVNLTTPVTYKMSDETSKDSYSFSFDVNEACQAWKAKVVSNPTDAHTLGTQVEAGGAIAAGGTVSGSITYSELVAAGIGAEGDKRLKFFAQDLAGNWSA